MADRKVNPDKTAINVWLSNELVRKLDGFCDRTGISKTRVVEAALANFLGEHGKKVEAALSAAFERKTARE